MSISSEITRLQGAKNTLKTKLNNKNDSQHQITDETIDEYGDFVDSIVSGAGFNLFIQSTAPSTFDGIWIKTNSLQYNNVVEIASIESKIASSINIVKGNIRETILFDASPSVHYKFGTIFITDNNNEIISNIEIYYGNGSSWVEILAHTEIEWIQCTGTQYIDTGIIPNYQTKIEIGLYSIDYSNCVIFSGASEWDYGIFTLVYQDSHFRWMYPSDYTFGQNTALQQNVVICYQRKHHI